MQAPPFASVIIPVLDDTDMLERQLVAFDAPISGCPPALSFEILIVDGGTTDQDGLHRLQERFPGVTWLASAAGRGRQMNTGARQARGRWLVFLHADTGLAAGWLGELCRLDEEAATVGGCFRFRLDADGCWARGMERLVAARVRVFGLAYGDQGLFVRRAVFEAMGGYREVPLMEDVDFIRRLARRGRIFRSRVPAVTSARRFEREGWLVRSSLNVGLVLLFLAGAPPAWLARFYARAPAGPAPAKADATREGPP